MPRRRIASAFAAALLGLCAPASAAAGARGEVLLPGDAAAATIRAEPRTWLVGARPGRAAAHIAALFGARHVGPAGTGGYLVPRGRARALAGALRRRGVLVHAEPNVLRRSHAAAAGAPDPLDTGWRERVVAPGLAAPAVGPQSPLIALVDAALDPTHPEWAGGNVATLGGVPVTVAHGTATASVAAAPQNGVGLTGLWPGARILNVPLDANISCADSAKGIARALRAGAAVINMSYGSAQPCRVETDAVQYAVGAGVVPVASAGNELADGNPAEYPASLAHVVTVASVAASDAPSYFSNANPAIDLAAPGENIPTAVPLALDRRDGVADGYEYQSGTSFSAPMVSAAIAWVRQARPQLRLNQVVDLVRYTARDVGRRGYEASTGYGVLQVQPALMAPPGLHDPMEPNDDMRWVNGRAFGKPATRAYRGRGRTRIEAKLDAVEDPADVYRMTVRPSGTVRVSAAPLYGGVVLSAYAPGARSLQDRRRRIAVAPRPGGSTQRLTVRNRSRAARTFLVALEVSGRRRDARYLLRVGR